MARTIVTVKASGGTYPTLKQALDAVPNITGITPEMIYGIPVSYEIQCYASAAGDATMAVTNYGTMDSGHWLRITCPPGEGNVGFWDQTKYYLDCPTANYFGLQLSRNYVLVDGLQVNASGTSGIGLYLGSNCVILNTITKGAGRPCNLNGGTVTFNNVIFDGGSTYNQQTSGAVVTFENCTIVRNGAYGWVNNGGSCAMKNTYVGGCTTRSVLGTITPTNCKSDDGYLGATAAFSTANFVSVTPGAAGYLKPLAGGALEDVGTTLTGDAAWYLGAVDIAGVARTSTWDIGAHESATGEPGTTDVPTGRTVTADTFRLLTVPTELWGGTGDPSAGSGAVGDAYFRADGALLVKKSSGWVNYAPVWKRTGALLEPATDGDAVNVPGALGVTGVGTFASSINPSTNYVSNLGSLTKKYLSLHAAELWVETLVAQNTLATIGGRILVGPTNTLTADLTAGAATIVVKYDNFASGDRVYMEAGGVIEWMSIDGAAGGSAGAYTYAVSRGLDSSGTGHAWSAGDAVFSTGQTGSGHIDLYSVRSLRSASHVGPTIVGNVRTSATYSDLSERWAIGNLRNLYGYGDTNIYGAAFGNPSGAWIKIDPTNGVRLGHASETKVLIDASGNASFAGAVTSTSGAIGGWTLGANSLVGGNATLASSGNLTLGTSNDVFRASADDATYRLWIGNVSAASAPFRATKAGVVTMSGAVITGPNVTLTTPSGFNADNIIKFSIPSGYGGGANDKFGLGAYYESNTRFSVWENIAHNNGANSDVSAYSWIFARGWRNATSGYADLAGITLLSSSADGKAYVTVTGGLYASSLVSATYPVFTGVQTYTISGDVNNYSMPADKYLWKVTNTSGAVRYVNGISANGATPEDGRILVISNCNASSQYVYLQHDNAGSTAAYRIYTRRQAAFEIRQNESAVLRYDAADSRWVQI